MNRNKNTGFSLIELMIVVALIGILTTIAMGFFGDNVIASNRSEGRAALTATAGSLEKCKSLYGSYNAGNCNVAFPIDTDTNYYRITATAISGTQYTLTANPITGEPQANDSDCTSMTLTNTGIKDGTPAGSHQCW